MKVIKITKQSIKEAVSVLKQGGAIVYPTETAYALGCDGLNSRAKAKIFKIKNRPSHKNLPMICATKKMASDFFKLGKIEKKLAKRYWPGPLSIILLPCHCEEPRDCRGATRQSRDCFASLAMTADGAPVRISSNKVARDLARKLGRPIVSTSANISGEKTLYDAKKIAEIFFRQKNQPDLILDAGKLPERKPSTIVKIIGEKIEVMRQGEMLVNVKFKNQNEK